ncbi:MAG TPA: GNAT family N-acyltransferase [Sandaracinaceae bacterium LLY-WYZ-13_1]|nr:GNAT family N-acyltransferase [Sandaracinaceae bacterium LLY-WYZ-13_1]
MLAEARPRTDDADRIYPVCRSAVPTGQLRAGRYVLRFARNLEDLHAIQRLRFEVFNLELGEGLDRAYELGRDEDELDASCHHLMVVHHATRQVVGTYRLMIRPVAQARGGFYSESELDFADLPDAILEDGVELGRACVAEAHRNGRVIHLLWRGLARYLSWNAKRYLFGCCSVPTLDEAVAKRMMLDLQARGAHHPTVCLRPLPALRCDASVAPAEASTELPPLFASYLSLGAQVCSEPAVDRDFKVIDFFVVLDVERMDPRVRRSLTDRPGWTEG